MSSTHQTRSKTATTAMLNNDPKAMFEEPLTLSTDESSLPTPVLKKRKRTLVQKKKLPVVDPTSEASLENSSSSKKKKTDPPPGKDKNEEKRLRVFRKRAPQSYLEKLHRATSQRYVALPSNPHVPGSLRYSLCRMFVIDRIHGGTDDVPEETIEMAGTTGNIYHVYISHLPSCTCPDNQKGNQCKHIVYVNSTAIFSIIPRWH